MVQMNKCKYSLVLVSCVMLMGCASKPVSDQSKITFTTNTAPDPVKPVVGTLEEGLRLARMLRDNGRFEGAVEVYGKLAQRGDLKGSLMLEYASVAAMVDAPKDTLTLFAQAKQSMGGNMNTMSPIEKTILCNGMGRARLALGQTDDAFKDFECTLAVDSKNVIALNGKAVLLDAKGEHSQAQALLLTAKDIDPANLMVINNLALSYLSEGKSAEAIRLLAQLDIPKNQPALTLNLAFAYLLDNKDSQALQVLMTVTSESQSKRLITQLNGYKSQIRQGEDVSTALLKASRQMLVLQEQEAHS